MRKVDIPNISYPLFAVSVMALSFFSQDINAQNLNKEVYVVSSYRPEITDADKLGSMPLIPDTFSIATSVDYSVLPSRLKSEFTLRPIKPAKMVGTPLDRLYNSQLKLGIGNYLTPLAEYNIQNLRSKESSIGAYAYHKSSHRKIDIGDVTKIPAGYGKNEILAYGKRFYKDVTLFAEAGANSHKLRHYGLNTEILADTFDVERSDIRQNFYNIHADAGLYSTRPDSGKLDYSLAISGNYFWDHYKNTEPHITVSGAMSHRIKSFRLGIESTYNNFSLKNSYETRKHSLFSVYPSLKKSKEEWQISLGFKVDILKSFYGDSVYIYPETSLRIRVIENALSGFIGVSGYMDQNSYQSLTTENPYIIPGIHTGITNHPYIIYGGVDGYLSRKASYKFDLSAEATQDMVFFINSDSTALQNQFEIVTDDADIIKLHGEINWEPLSFLSFFISSNYYSYKLYALEKPWHRPAFELFAITRYNFKQKIYADVEFIMLGKRYANDLNTGQAKTLDPIYDLNLKIEYKYSNVLSIFLDFYNLTSKEYYLWNQYPVQRLNVIGGIVYKF